MTERVKKYLFDILYAIDVIEEFLHGMNFLEYEADLKTKVLLSDKWQLLERQ